MNGPAHANWIDGEWRPPVRGARFEAPGGGEPWPQSGVEEVAQAWGAARAARAGWAALPRPERARHLSAVARALEHDAPLATALEARFALPPGLAAEHLAGLEDEVRTALAHAPATSGVSWLAPDWSELLRAPLRDLARQMIEGRALVLVSDPALPELGAAFGRAAHAAELPRGAFTLLHGPARELLGLALARAEPAEARLVASARVERTAELRRTCERHGVEAELRAVRAGACEVDPSLPLEASARSVLERAFGPGRTFGGQLSGSLARVFCPARRFSRFTELCLAELQSEAYRTPVPLLDAASASRVRAAWELGLDEGATCIAGGEDGVGLCLPATIFTNVELHMASARRQDPLPILCLLRGS